MRVQAGTGRALYAIEILVRRPGALYDDLTHVVADAIELAGTEMMRSVGAIYAQHALLLAGAYKDLSYMKVFVVDDFSRRTDELGRPLDMGPPAPP